MNNGSRLLNSEREIQVRESWKFTFPLCSLLVKRTWGPCRGNYFFQKIIKILIKMEINNIN